jgi:hypothetical protein
MLHQKILAGPVDLNGPGCYVWRHPRATALIQSAGARSDCHVIKIGKSVSIGDRADEGTEAKPTARSIGKFVPQIYAELPGWRPWRCVAWDVRQSLEDQEIALKSHFRKISDEERNLIYSKIVPSLTEIPAGTEIFVANLADAAAHFPYCAETGNWKRPAFGPIQDTTKPY